MNKMDLLFENLEHNFKMVKDVEGKRIEVGLYRKTFEQVYTFQVIIEDTAQYETIRKEWDTNINYKWNNLKKFIEFSNFLKQNKENIQNFIKEKIKDIGDEKRRIKKIRKKIRKRLAKFLKGL